MIRAVGSYVVQIEYRPASIRLDTVLINGKVFAAISFDEALHPSPAAAAGEPDIPCRNIPIAFPSSAGADVRIVAADFQELRGLSPRPVPAVRVRDGFIEPVGFTGKDTERSGMMPTDIVRIVTPSRVRSALVGGVRFWPVQYDRNAQALRTYSRIVVEITFREGTAAAVDPADVLLIGKGVANPELLQARQSGGPPPRMRKPASSVLATGEWYQLTVAEEGIYRIDASFLSAAGIPVGSVDPRTIRIFGNGGRELPEDPMAVRPVDLVEVACHVEGEADGQFGPGDYMLFYGRGTRGIAYDSASRSLRHYINHYSEVNYYWLTFGGIGGKRMALRPSLAGAPGVVVEEFNDALFMEEEKVNLLGSGKDWFGQSLSGPSGTATYTNVLPGLIAGGSISYRFSFAAHDATPPRFIVKEGGTVLGTYQLSSISGEQYASAGTWEEVSSPSPVTTTSQLSVTFSSSSAAAEGWIDWIEIRFPRMLHAVNNCLRFRSPNATAIAEFRLQQFTAAPAVFDVTDHGDVRMITGLTGSFTFRDSLVSGSVKEYCAAGPAAWKVPSAVQKVANQDLRGYAEGAEFIIVTSSEFRSAADRLKAFREEPSGGGLKTVVVDVSDIYREFGGGISDISAVRDYLRHAYETWSPRPLFVLFLGAASYDYKAILGSKSSYTPTWQSAESRNDVDSYATDDFFALFFNNPVPSLIVGRIPSRTAAEANSVVEKILRYETGGARDNWKTRILYVGDDGWTPDYGDTEGPGHSNEAEAVASPAVTPDAIEKKKIYIAEYPTVHTPVGRRKPGAYSDIIKSINQGVLMVNYSGHGNTKVWAHESIFDVSTSIPQLVNAERLSVFVLATCNFSQFDDPANPCGGELLLNKPDGGASAVLAASRKVFQMHNAPLNQRTNRIMFGRDSFGRTSVERPATALFLYKAAGVDLVNDQKFFWMGDPTMRLAYPRGFASIDSINGQPLGSASGVAGSAPVTLRALSRVTVAGTIRDAADRPDTAFDGTISLSVNDVSRQRTIVNFSPGVPWQYVASGGTIHRGESSVSGGRFRATFVVPKDIAYGDTSSRGRMAVYANRMEDDGTGFTNAIRIAGTDTSAPADHEGPQLGVFFNNRAFRSGDMVGEDPMLIVDLRDSSGINTSASGIGHRIEAWLNTSMESVDLTGYYSSARDNFCEGTVQMQLTGLKEGRHSIRVRAWDSYNNSSSAETFFEVAASDRLTIGDLFNYPNPFVDETQFTFRHNQQGPLDVEIKVYTVAGRLIQNLRTLSVGELMVRVPWDGRDRDGDRIANGIYLYKVIVRTVDGRLAGEAIGKLSIAR